MATGFFSKLKERLGKTRTGFVDNVRSIFQGHSKLDEPLYEELEEVLIQADIGVHTSLSIVEEASEASKNL